MARFLVDEALPRSLAGHLRAAGYDADDVRDLGLRGEPDERIFLEAQQRSAVLITADLGFTNILRFPPQSHAGLILVRFPSVFSAPRLVQEVVRNLNEVPLTALAHTVVIVGPARTRIRRFD